MVRLQVRGAAPGACLQDTAKTAAKQEGEKMPSIFSCLISVLLMSPGGTGDVTLYGFLGFGMSQLDEDMFTAEGSEMYYNEVDNGSYVPAGAVVLYQVSPRFQLGAEVEVCASSFSGDYTWYDEYGYSGEGEWETSMTTLGATARFLATNDIYLRGGVASYSASQEAEDEYSAIDFDYESGFGFNFGAGYITPLSETVFGGLEGVYHIVSLEPDLPYAMDDIKLDHYAVRAMIGTTL